MHARVLKVHTWIPHEKIAERIFFSDQDFAPFLSYGPLKKYGWNMQCWSQAVLESGSWGHSVLQTPALVLL